LRVEPLEDRCVPATFLVNTLQDLNITGVNLTTGVIPNTGGAITLRSAIAAVNSSPPGASNSITFTIVGDYHIALPPGSVPGTNNSGAFTILLNGNDLSIQNGTGGTVSLDGNNLDRVFDLVATNNPSQFNLVDFIGFTVQNGFAHPGGTVAGSGGGIRVQGNVELDLIGVNLTDNYATANGGGIALVSPSGGTGRTLTLNGTQVTNNRAGDSGGGIEYDGAGTVNIVNTSKILNNVATRQGGGVWLGAVGGGSANLTFQGVEIDNNQALTGPGGGVGNAGNGAVNFTQSTLAHNSAGGMGGGFADAGGLGTVYFLDSTVTSSVALGPGGGVAETNPARVTTLYDSTVTGNQSLGTAAAPGDGGGVFAQPGGATLANTIVATNFSGPANLTGGTAPDIDAAVTGQGNFIGSGDSKLTGISNNTQGNQIGTVADPLNPLLGPLQNNGGNTLTRVPQPGSPVIDKGVNNAVPPDPITHIGVQIDQRGLPRVVHGTQDVGAVEVQAGAQTVGVFDPSTATWYLRSANNSGAPDVGQFAYGSPGWLPVVGDWTGSGQDAIAVVDPKTETWYVRLSDSAGAPDIAPFQFGAPGWIPLAGDWTGTGHFGIGVFDPSTATFYLRNEVSSGAPDAGTFKYGAPGWIPVVGDWTGARHFGVGVVDPATETWYLRNTPSAGGTDFTPFQYGSPGWKPVVADWNGDGTTTVGTFDPARGNWYIRNGPAGGGPDAIFAYGAGAWTPVPGQWDRNVPRQDAADGEGPGAPAISTGDLNVILTAALGRLEQAGVSQPLLNRLSTVNAFLQPLAPGQLGEALVNQNAIVLSPDGAGHGWFVDPTPSQDEEFAGGSAFAGSPAAGREDLLTTVLHELGHLVGLADDNGTALMAESLPTGTRRTDALGAVFANLVS
jgi:hypothetical protein